MADGTERMVDLILAPVTDEAGRVLFVAATGTDVTDRRRMEDALREQDRRKDEFLALLAHELRNPLAPLRNSLQVMRLAAGDPDAVAEARAMMERQLGHMVRLIDDLLDVSRINRNKMELRRSRVLLGDVIGGAVETARPAIEAAGHALTVALPPEPVYLDADLTRLAQVFGNLLSNSAKYTPRGGHIRLTAERRGSTSSSPWATTGSASRPGRWVASSTCSARWTAASSAPPAGSASAWPGEGVGRDARRRRHGRECRGGEGQHVHRPAPRPGGPPRTGDRGRGPGGAGRERARAAHPGGGRQPGLAQLPWR